MPSAKRRYAKEEFARRGDEIYDSHVRPHLKADDEGKFAAIDIESGTYEIDADELDFAKGYEMPDPKSTQDLVDFFEKRLIDGLTSLRGADDARFSERWKLRRGENIFMETSKLEIVRMTINHMVHHRGQLSVFMRLKDIPIPPIYGPTADEGQM